ncbi:MAG: vitamin B12 dependent methionine synthase [Chloroflexi bacterium]|nr:MAG: vitamin B12 dependent methionine synthase [Chloroflexota bacterium]
MDAVVLNDIRFQPDVEGLKRKLRVRDGGGWADRFTRLVQEAEAIARPRALYGVAYVDSRSEGSVVVDGITLNSRVLRVNLENAHRVFPFLATCGTELHEWAAAQEDVLQRYYADEIAEAALRQALSFLREHLNEGYRLGRTSTMSPGSLPDWPIQAQRPLFALIGKAEELLGVRLTDSLLMVPSKSVSGIRFPTEQTFASCQLCPRAGCPSRQAPYDAALYDEKYRIEKVETSATMTQEAAH